MPGMGELRSSYRHTRPALVHAGFRVATMDLRGHGDSDATFAAYDDVAAGTDALALIEHLRQPAVLIGNSMSAGAAVWAAAFTATTRTSHAPAEARLDDVHVPTLVIMGTRDPDFPDPTGEAHHVADRLGGEALLTDGAGHYPALRTSPRQLKARASAQRLPDSPGTKAHPGLYRLVRD